MDSNPYTHVCRSRATSYLKLDKEHGQLFGSTTCKLHFRLLVNTCFINRAPCIATSHNFRALSMTAPVLFDVQTTDLIYLPESFLDLFLIAFRVCETRS